MNLPPEYEEIIENLPKVRCDVEDGKAVRHVSLSGIPANVTEWQARTHELTVYRHKVTGETVLVARRIRHFMEEHACCQ